MKFLKWLGFDPEKHSVRTEILAGLTTFLTMAYILAVNPNVFDALGGEMSKANGAVFTATALAAIIGTLAMAFIAKKPFALAPGMGLNTFFVYTVCIAMGHSWQFALTAVFIEGVVFVILTLTNVRKWIVDALPLSLKYAVGAGIGLIIAFLGFQNAGIVGQGPTLVTLAFKLPDGSFSGTALLGILGLVITGALVMKGVRGSILWGILATTALGLIPMYNVVGADGAVSRVALTSLNGIVSVPPSIENIAFQFTWSELASAKGILDMIVVLFTFLFLDIFDTMGTVIGVSEKAGYVDKEGNVDGINECFMADSIGTICGAALGTSTTTTYVESAAGVSHRFFHRHLLRHRAPFRADLPGHPVGRHSPCAHRGGHDDDDACVEDQLERPRRGASGLHHDGGDALQLQHQRRHPHRSDKLCAPQRPVRQHQEHHPHHVGAGGALCAEIYLHMIVASG